MHPVASQQLLNSNWQKLNAQLLQSSLSESRSQIGGGGPVATNTLLFICDVFTEMVVLAFVLLVLVLAVVPPAPEPAGSMTALPPHAKGTAATIPRPTKSNQRMCASYMSLSREALSAMFWRGRLPPC